MHVASVVPNPDRLVDEMRRSCKPGGDIILVNHFASEHVLLGKLEALLRPLSAIPGFRPDMALDTLVNGVDLKLIQLVNTNLLYYWKLIHYRNESPSTSAAESFVI